MPQHRARRVNRQQTTPYASTQGRGGGRGQQRGQGRGGQNNDQRGGGQQQGQQDGRTASRTQPGRKGFTQVVRSPGGQNKQIEEMSKALWKAFLAKRWNPQECMLDLTGMVGDETLKAVGAQTDLNIMTSCNRLCEILSEDYVHLGLKTISLANNGIRALHPWAQAHARFDLPIQNLSFANNQLTKVDELRALSKLKLRELVFTGNPIQANPQTYGPAVLKHLRKLDMVDGEKIPHNVVLPPTAPGYADKPESVQLIADIFNKWVSAAQGNQWDNVVELYAPKCFFSLTVFDPRGGRDEQGLLARVPAPVQPFRNEVQSQDCNVAKFGRMLTAKNNPAKLRISCGRIDVVNALKAIYSAKGTVTSEHDGATVVVDCCQPAPGMIIAHIHGRVAFKGAKQGAVVSSANTIRLCFDRTWVVNAEKRFIMNDTLTLRRLADSPAIVPAPQPQQ